MTAFKVAVRPGVADAPLYVPGSHEAGGAMEPAVLSANENPLGASARAVEAYRAAADHLHRYPDGGATKLREMIGRTHGLDPARITCGAGSDEIITMLTRIFAGPGDEVLYSQHGFMMYPISATQVGATPVSAPEKNLTTDVDAVLERITDKTRLIFIANPNNPTGSYLGDDEMKRLVEGVPENVLLVIDAAYAEYVTRNDYTNATQLVDAHPNVVMTRTFSKIHGLAALRLGWCYAGVQVTELMNRIRGPFNVGSPALAAGLAAMEDVSHVERSIAHNDAQLRRFTTGLEDLGLEVPPSVGNFLLAGFSDGETASRAYDYMLSQGVIGRVMGGYGLPAYIRLTVGLEDEIDRALEALREFRG